jgi:uncharacterized protein YodC (DUF2158 family)
MNKIRLNEEDLQYTFAADEIINSGKFNLGDFVILKSGGPKTTIVKFCLPLNGNDTRIQHLSARCQYYVRKELREMWFPVVCLEKWEE